MKSIEILTRILRFFGWVSIALGGLSLLIHIVAAHPVFLMLILGFSDIQVIFIGLVFLGLDKGLSKKEKWAWYTAFIIFVLNFLFNIIRGFLIEFSVGIFLSVPLNILFLGLLIKGKQLFIEQPKEKISLWLHKPYFVMVVVGIFISYLISGGILAWQYFEVSKREVETSEKKASEEVMQPKGIILETEVIRYIPTEIPDKVVEGSCDVNAFSTIRRDAWRCMMRNYIKDPCFVFEANKNLVCEPNPAIGDKGILLKLTEPLPEPNISKDKFGEGWAWLIELEDGGICNFITGATGVVNGKRINFSCGKFEIAILGDLEVGPIWKAEKAVLELVGERWQAKSVELVPIKRVWQ